MRILVVDDYRAHAESLVDLLETMGHEALHAPNYSEAQWLLDLFRFDLAILDFDMPQMSGPAIAARLAQRFPDIHSIIMSAHSPEGERKSQLGELEFLPKPLDREVLGELLERIDKLATGWPLILRKMFPMVKYE